MDDQYMPTGLKDEKGRELYLDRIIGGLIPSEGSLWKNKKISFTLKNFNEEKEETKVEEKKEDKVVVECVIQDPVRRKECMADYRYPML